MRWLNLLGQPDWVTIAELAFVSYEARHHHWFRWIHRHLERRHA